MGLLEDLLTRASPGGFPAVPVPPIDPIEEATAAQQARDAAYTRLRRNLGQDKPLPEGSLLPFGTIGAGMLPSTNAPQPSTAPGPAIADAAPIEGDVPLPRARPQRG
jgi:hypothetical protein